MLLVGGSQHNSRRLPLQRGRELGGKNRGKGEEKGRFPIGLVLLSCGCQSNPTGHSGIHSNISWAPTVCKADQDPGGGGALEGRRWSRGGGDTRVKSRCLFPKDHVIRPRQPGAPPRERTSRTRPAASGLSARANVRLVLGAGGYGGTIGPSRRPPTPPLEAWERCATPQRPGLWDLPLGGSRGQTRPKAGLGTQRPSAAHTKEKTTKNKNRTADIGGFLNPKPRAWPPHRMPGPPCPRPNLSLGKGARRPLPAREGAWRRHEGTPALTVTAGGDRRPREPGWASSEGGQRPGPAYPPQVPLGLARSRRLLGPSHRFGGLQTGPEP